MQKCDYTPAVSIFCMLAVCEKHTPKQHNRLQPGMEFHGFRANVSPLVYLYIYILYINIRIYIYIYIYTHIVYTYTFEGSFEVKLSTIWTDEKHRWEESEKRREEKREENRREEKRREKKKKEKERRRKKIKKRKYQKKEDPGARKGRKAAKHCVFPIFVAPEGQKVGSLKRRVRSQLAR